MFDQAKRSGQQLPFRPPADWARLTSENPTWLLDCLMLQTFTHHQNPPIRPSIRYHYSRHVSHREEARTRTRLALPVSPTSPPSTPPPTPASPLPPTPVTASTTTTDTGTSTASPTETSEDGYYYYTPEPGITRILPHRLRWRHGIPSKYLRRVSAVDKANLFRGLIPIPADQLAEAEALLERLSRLNRHAALSFVPKFGDLDCLNFRLLVVPSLDEEEEEEEEEDDDKGTAGAATFPTGTVCLPGSGEPVALVQSHASKQIKGYYALSYRWNSSAAPRIWNHGKCGRNENSSKKKKKRRSWLPSEREDSTDVKTHDTAASTNKGERTASPYPASQTHLALPTSAAMFAAILAEIPPDGSWGLWCDQICIDEADETERNLTVGMMDVIYKRAEWVLVALDDIELDARETEALAAFGAWYDGHAAEGRVPEDQDLDYMRARPALRSTVEKIIGSEYFERAWCAHEFELAGDRLVLIRAASSGEGRDSDGDDDDDSGKTRIIRIPNEKLHSLMLLLPLDASGGSDAGKGDENGKKAVVSPQQAHKRVNVELLISRSDRNDPSLRSRMVHDMQTMALISGMQAGGDPSLSDELRPYSAVKDKMSIMLNACECNLQPAEEEFGRLTQLPIALATARAHQNIMLLMLANANPLVLATTGKSIFIDQTHESWLRHFWLLDAGIDASIQPLPLPMNLELDPSRECRWIKLALVFPSTGGRLHTASSEYLDTAADFIQEFHHGHPEKASTPTGNPEIQVDHMKHLIACILECGARWKGKRDWKETFGTRSTPWEYFFSDMISFGGMAAEFDKSPFKPMQGLPNWKRHHMRATEASLPTSTAALAASTAAVSDQDGFKTDREQRTALQMAGELMSNLLLSAPMPESRGDAVAWRPAWFEVGPPGHGRRYIVMAPRSTGKYRVAVPAILKSSVYGDLARCWVLEDKEDQPSGRWFVRCRSKLMMMDSDALQPEIDKGFWECKPDQTVWGRDIRRGSESVG